MRLLTAGWDRCRRSPAAEKLPVSAMAMKVARLARSMFGFLGVIQSMKNMNLCYPRQVPSIDRTSPVGIQQQPMRSSPWPARRFMTSSGTCTWSSSATMGRR
ncbi:hypothetical protein D3C75_712460 [compost metagenome]